MIVVVCITRKIDYINTTEIKQPNTKHNSCDQNDWRVDFKVMFISVREIITRKSPSEREP